jgi:hypothetical protein
MANNQLTFWMTIQSNPLKEVNCVESCIQISTIVDSMGKGRTMINDRWPLTILMFPSQVPAPWVCFSRIYWSVTSKRQEWWLYDSGLWSPNSTYDSMRYYRHRLWLQSPTHARAEKWSDSSLGSLCFPVPTVGFIEPFHLSRQNAKKRPSLFCQCYQIGSSLEASSITWKLCEKKKLTWLYPFHRNPKSSFVTTYSGFITEQGFLSNRFWGFSPSRISLKHLRYILTFSFLTRSQITSI